MDSLCVGLNLAMPDVDLTRPFEPANDVQCWLDQESSIMLKAVTRFGDPVELTAREARAIADSLINLASRLDAEDLKTD
jgi:hypothetical protein